jgi:hypothetical protein
VLRKGERLAYFGEGSELGSSIYIILPITEPSIRKEAS